MTRFKDSLKNLPIKRNRYLLFLPFVLFLLVLTFVFYKPNSSSAFFECFDCGCGWELDCCDDCPCPCEPSPTPIPPDECEKESWTCEECQVAPEEGICHEEFVGYCADNFGCSWVSPLDELSVAQLSTRLVWVCDNKCEPEPSPKPDPTPTPTQSGNGDRGGPSGPPVCGASTPLAPYLKSAIYLGGNKVELKWDPVANATHYTISYGGTSGNYPWGVPNTGNQTSYTVEGISSGCFIAYAVNDCAPSEVSNEVCTGQVQGKVLGLSSTSSKDGDSFLFSLGLLMIASGVIILGKEAYTLR